MDGETFPEDQSSSVSVWRRVQTDPEEPVGLRVRANSQDNMPKGIQGHNVCQVCAN